MNSPRLPQPRQPARAKTATPASTAVAAAPKCEIAAVCAARCHRPPSLSAMSSPSPSTLSAVRVCTPAAPPVHTPRKAVQVSAQRAGCDSTAAVFQVKLQRALWLDQITTIAHNEARSRARTRCIEAEERDVLWWQHHRERECQQHTEDNARRLEALHKSKAAPACNVVPHCCADLVEREESNDRRAVEAAALEGLQALRAALHTWDLRRTVIELVRQQRDAQEVHHAAKHVRALELKLAAHSYRAVPAFEPAVDDLFDIAEGVHPSVSAPPSLTVLPSRPLSVDHEAPCEAKIREMHDRRALAYDEAKELLLLNWWKGAAQLLYIEALNAGQTFVLWSYYVRSPVCMYALLTVQRWWRMQRVAPWSQHRRASLVRSLTKLPGYYSVERCLRHLRSLQRTASRRDKDTCAADDVNAALVALVTAATSPRRYTTLLDLYTYTAVQRAHVMLASRPIQGAATEAMMQASLRMWSRYPLPYDSWRRHRWVPYSEAHRLSVAVVERAEKSHRQCVEDEEAEHRHRAALLSSILHCGQLAVSELQGRQVTLAQEERTSRLRITHQRAHECHVLRAAVAAALPSPSQVAPSSKLHEMVIADGKGKAKTAAAGMGTSVATHSLGDQGATQLRGAIAASFSAEHDAWAQAQRCVLLAHEVLASTQQQSAQVRLEQRGSSTGIEAAAPSPEDAASLYCAALDEAAAAVYRSQYTAVRERYVARNAHALEHMRQSFKVGLRERAIIIAEEAQELKRICCCDTSAQRVSCCKLEQRESDGRAVLERARGRAAADLCEMLHNSLCFSQWTIEVRERVKEVHRAAARVWLRPSLPLPSLSPVDRLISREAVCRTRLVRDCVTALTDALLRCSRSHHELQYQDWATLCRTNGAGLDSATPSNPPVAQMCLLKADEWNGRQVIWREAQVGTRTLLVDGHALYITNTVRPDYLFGHLKLMGEAYYMDAQLRDYLLVRLANVKVKMGEFVMMETMARGRVEYAEAITRELRFHLHRLRLE